MHFADLADDARAHHINRAAVVDRRVPLVAHLRDHSRLRCNLPHHPRLVNRLGQGLLDVDMLSQFHRGDGDRGVHVIGGRDGDCIDILPLKHQTKIFIHPGLREHLARRTSP